MAFIPWYPLATGNLTRDDRLQNIATKHRKNTGQIALSWLLHKSPAILPIPGTCSVKHLEQNFQALSIELDDEDMKQLEELNQE